MAKHRILNDIYEAQVFEGGAEDLIKDMELASGKIAIGQSTGLAAGKTPSGDLTIDADGVFTIGDDKIAAAELGVTAGTVTASKALVVDSSKDLTGIRNLTLEGRLAMGSMGLGPEYSTDELIELHGLTAAADCGKPMVRFRVSPKQAMTTGTLWCLQAQAYGNATGHNLLTAYGLHAEAGIKAANGILTGGAIVGGRFKVEDLGNDATFAGTAKSSAIQAWGQYSAGTTFAADYAYNLFELGIEGNITLDAFFHHSTIIGGANVTKAFFTTVEAVAVSSDTKWISLKNLTGDNSLDIENDAAIRLVVDTGGSPTNYWIPLYNG